MLTAYAYRRRWRARYYGFKARACRHPACPADQELDQRPFLGRRIARVAELVPVVTGAVTFSSEQWIRKPQGQTRQQVLPIQRVPGRTHRAQSLAAKLKPPGSAKLRTVQSSCRWPIKIRPLSTFSNGFNLRAVGSVPQTSHRSGLQSSATRPDDRLCSRTFPGSTGCGVPHH